jgi:hypothetical protein
MGIEFFESAAEAGAQLLKVDLRPDAAASDRLSVLILTFDVGSILLRAETAREELSIEFVDAGAPRPAGLVDGQEEEPWWRVLGANLARAWRAGDLNGSVCLQFRADDQSPRIVTLEARGASLSVRLENPPE